VNGYISYYENKSHISTGKFHHIPIIQNNFRITWIWGHSTGYNTIKRKIPEKYISCRPSSKYLSNVHQRHRGQYPPENISPEIGLVLNVTIQARQVGSRQFRLAQFANVITFRLLNNKRGQRGVRHSLLSTQYFHGQSSRRLCLFARNVW